MLTVYLLSLPLFAQEIAPQVQDEEAPPAVEEPLPITVMPELTHFEQAPYPEEALAEQVEGSVGLLLEIDETGTVTSVEVLTSAGYGFDEAATTAAQSFQFSPAEDATGPIPVAIEFAYGFVLDAAATEEAIPEEEILEPVNLDGQVIEMVTRTTLPEMAVVIQGLDLSTTTDSEGSFSFRGVPNGFHTLQVARPGWETTTYRVQVVSGEISSAKLWIKNQNYGQNEAVGVYRREREEVTPVSYTHLTLPTKA